MAERASALHNDMGQQASGNLRDFCAVSVGYSRHRGHPHRRCCLRGRIGVGGIGDYCPSKQKPLGRLGGWLPCDFVYAFKRRSLFERRTIHGLLYGLAILAVLRDAPAWLAGLLLGCGFMVKYVCAPEILVTLALLWHRRRAVRSAIEALLAASIPLLAVTLLYACAGRLPLWWECGITANFRRAEVPLSAHQLWAAVEQQAKRWGTLYLAGAWAALRMYRLSTPLWFLPLWLLAALIGAAGAKSFYDHYFLQILPPLCISAGLIFARLPCRLLPRLAFLLILAMPACPRGLDRPFAGLRARSAAHRSTVSALRGRQEPLCV